ncbi:potassium/proton antiporter [uncultured Faecalibaculum sp.]|uniref:potassium/proton antiporter n=1 Tax=uncultured Faecalibaculum sp. TaxID=1729681 RepID=UPI0027298C39|nr:potassium/proton antiporter [uncultured Faecalibaculum sp.]
MVTVLLLMAAIVIILSVIVSRLASRLKVPMLLGFIFLGLFVGNDASLGPVFSDFALTESICTAALVIVMFDGGFQTRWKAAKKAALPAGILATAGVLTTAALTGLFCHYALGMPWLTALLTGSLISSTDAASVFSILRNQKLALRDHTDSLLELESGSNDPVSYLLVTVILTMMQTTVTWLDILWILLCQIGIGLLAGWLISRFALWFLSKVQLEFSGFLTVFVLACALMAYAGSTLLAGNGYLAVYLAGLILGNSRLRHKKELVPFFDGLSTLMQMTIFFILGLLADPDSILAVLPLSFGIFLFLTLVARPAAVFLCLSGFRSSLAKKLVVSAAGLRGAASIVFAIMARMTVPGLGQDVFHIVFGVVLFSISLQGTLLPWIARRLHMSDESGNVLKTFSDYGAEPDLQFSLLELGSESGWAGKTLAELALPPGMATALVIRDGERIIPEGGTLLQKQDRLVITTQPYHSARNLLDSEVLDGDDPRIGKSLAEIASRPIVCISRHERMLIPDGTTLLQEGDTLVFVQKNAL